MSMKEEMNKAAPVLDRVNDAIRDNPLAAGLIGAGLAWMLFGAKGVDAMSALAKGAGGKVASAARTAGSLAVGAGSATLDAGAAASSAVKGAAADMVGSVASIVPDLSQADTDGVAKGAADAGTAINERIQAMASSGREYGAVIQSRLSQSLEQQPLLLGALGLAIGAGIASTFATTQAESEWMGEKGSATRETLQGMVGDAKDQARQVVSDIQDEAARQGLTLDAAKDAAKAVASKVGNVAGAARNSVTQPFKSPT
jgi:hypothetical protein